MDCFIVYGTHIAACNSWIKAQKVERELLRLILGSSIFNTRQILNYLQRVGWLSIYRLYDNRMHRRMLATLHHPVLSGFPPCFACRLSCIEYRNFCTFNKPKLLTYRLKFGIIPLRRVWEVALSDFLILL